MDVSKISGDRLDSSLHKITEPDAEFSFIGADNDNLPDHQNDLNPHHNQAASIVSSGLSGMHRAAEKRGLEDRDVLDEILKMPAQSQAMLIQDEESFLGAAGNQSLLLD